MTLRDLCRYGCINLWRKKSRTVLTMLSMAIGVMCVIVLISVGLGYEQSYRESLEQVGSLTKIEVTPVSSELGGRRALLNDKAVEAFKGIAGVEAVTPVLQQSAYIKSGNYINMVRLYGIDMDTAANFQIVPEEGDLPGEGQRLAPDVMFTDDVAGTFSNAGSDWSYALDENGNPLVDPLVSPIRLTFDYSNLTGGQEADADGRAIPSGNFYTLHVTGICSTQNNTFSTSAFLNYDRLAELVEANADYLGTASEEAEQSEETGPTYDLVWVKVRDVDDVQRIAQTIREAGLNTYSLNDMLETVRAQSRQIQGMLGAIGAVAMLVSAICVANTMMMAITERRREIGVLKVLGAARRDISAMFLMEALIVGVLGGVIGLGLSYAMKGLIPVLFAQQGIQSVLPAWLAVCGVLFAGMVALLAALIPTRRSLRISPNEALRAE